MALTVLLLALAGVTYYSWYYPPSALRHASQAALDDFAAALATKEQAKIDAMFKDRLTDAAKIHLEVSFFSLSQGNNRPEVQDFDKATFITFVDNILYSMTDYSFHATLQDFSPAGDRKSADITFIADAWADGNSYFSGTEVNMRFVTNSTCSAQVAFENKHAILDKMDCRMTVHSAPKPGEEKKLQSPEAIRQLLK